MVYVDVPGIPHWAFGNVMPGRPLTALSTSALIDATGEIMAFMGEVQIPGGGSKDITRVQFRFGAVTKAGGSALTVSLQNVNLAAGPPTQPDGTQDQTVAIANADASFVSNTWYRTGALSANRTVAQGELLSICVEYDGAGRLGADSVIVNTAVNTDIGTDSPMLMVSSLFTAGAWARLQGQGHNVLLEFSDGTFGTLGGDFVISGTIGGGGAFNSGTADPVRGNRFTVPWECECGGIWAYVLAGTSAADYELRLYEGTSVLATCTFDGNTTPAASSQYMNYGYFASRVALRPGTVYYAALAPTTANNIQVYQYTVNNTTHLAIYPGGESIYKSTLAAGVWTDVTTVRTHIGPLIASIGVGGGIRMAGSGGLAGGI